MEDLRPINEQINQDGLINPNNVNFDRKKASQIKEIRLGADGLMERNVGKVVTNDGRELLKED